MKNICVYEYMCIYLQHNNNKKHIMRTKLLNAYQIALEITDIAKGETRKSLAIEIVKLTECLQNKVPVYVLFNKRESLIYITMNEYYTKDNFNSEYRLIMKIEKSKELNKYKLYKYEQVL